MQEEKTFWDKKIIISYGLAILVYMIHYSMTSKHENIIIPKEWFVLDEIKAGGIASVAVPLFFVISGAVYFRDTFDWKIYLKKTKNRLFSLVIPYIWWNLVKTIYTYALTRLHMGGVEKINLSVCGIFEALVLHKYHGALWFLFSLIIFSIISPCIYIGIKNKYIGIIYLIGLLFMECMGWGPPCLWHTHAIIMYSLGGYIALHYGEMFFSLEKKRYDWILVLTTFVCMILNWWLTTTDAVVSIKVWFSCIIQILEALCLWQGVNTLLPIIPKYNWMKHSFMVYAMHQMVSAVIVNIVYRIFPQKLFWIIPEYFVVIIITLLTINSFSEILCRHFPKIYFICSGRNVCANK